MVYTHGDYHSKVSVITRRCTRMSARSATWRHPLIACYDFNWLRWRNRHSRRITGDCLIRGLDQQALCDHDSNRGGPACRNHCYPRVDQLRRDACNRTLAAGLRHPRTRPTVFSCPSSALCGGPSCVETSGARRGGSCRWMAGRRACSGSLWHWAAGRR